MMLMTLHGAYVAILGGSDGYVAGQSEYVGLKRKSQSLVQDARRGMVNPVDP